MSVEARKEEEGEEEESRKHLDPESFE